MLVARRYVLSGRVQGVGFRYFAKEAAEIEGLSGWVANRPDGSVEVMAEGEASALRRFEARLRRGPAHAQVETFQADDDVPSARSHGFSIRS